MCCSESPLYRLIFPPKLKLSKEIIKSVDQKNSKIEVSNFSYEQPEKILHFRSIMTSTMKRAV